VGADTRFWFLETCSIVLHPGYFFDAEDAVGAEYVPPCNPPEIRFKLTSPSVTHWRQFNPATIKASIPVIEKKRGHPPGESAPGAEAEELPPHEQAGRHPEEDGGQLVLTSCVSCVPVFSI